MLLSSEQRTPGWLAARQGRITASLAAACLGLDPYTSRQKAWRTILGTEAKSGNRHMRWGEEFEATARQAYETETGNLVTETGLWVHNSLDWLGASPDGLIGEDGLAEIKCPGKLPERVPIHHRIQMLIQLFVTDRKWCDYYVWTHNGTFCRRVYPAGTQNLVNRLEAFYRQFVVPGIEPPRKKRCRASSS